MKDKLIEKNECYAIDNTVLSYGFNTEVNNALREKLPKGIKLYIADCDTDIIAIPSMYQFVNPEALTSEELNSLMSCWKEMI